MNTITALFITIGLLILAICYYQYQENKYFERWYEQLIKQAPFYGFTQEDIDDFERGVWYQYYNDEKNIEEAIKEYLSEN